MRSVSRAITRGRVRLEARRCSGKFTVARRDNERVVRDTRVYVRYYLFAIIPDLSLLRIILVSLFVDAVARTDKCPSVISTARPAR